ncbi:hypothetical protein ACIRBX_31705 [Kitasatospora sp. NPDC096147]|uniref:hypothetical protein n=1 Tax=Kitasatospora sp. NPDC096147 TaxID=3364093 RepID=UPI0037F5B417
MKKTNRLFAAVALSGAALAAAAAPASAAAPAGMPDVSKAGGVFGLVAFTGAELLTGVDPTPPDPETLMEQAKKQQQEEAAKQQAAKK